MKKLILFVFLSFYSINSQAGFPDDFSDVIWLDPDISSWPATGSLSVSVTGPWLNLVTDKATVWPAIPHPILRNSPCCNRNAWGFINFGGQWYAATWEWMSFGQNAKAASSFDGGHLKRAPFFNGTIPWWEPKCGEIYGFMLSGFARFGLNVINVRERTEIAFYQWCVGPYEFPTQPDINLVPITDLLLEEDEVTE